jgi:hypothetical protein
MSSSCHPNSAVTILSFFLQNQLQPCFTPPRRIKALLIQWCKHRVAGILALPQATVVQGH